MCEQTDGKSSMQLDAGTVAKIYDQCLPYCTVQCSGTLSGTVGFTAFGIGVVYETRS
jgi:hypothetical protein